VTVAATLGLALVPTGCWPQEGYDAARSGFNPFESTLTPAKVPLLTRAWGADVGATATTPVVDGSAVFLGAGDAVEAIATATGSSRWVTHNTDLDSGFPATVGPVNHVHGDVLAPVNWGVAGGLFTFDGATGAREGEPQFHSGIRGSVAQRGDESAHVRFDYGSGGPFGTTLDYGSHRALLDVVSSGSPAPVTSPSIIGRTVLVGVGTAVQAYSLDTCTPVPQATQFCLPAWSTTVGAAPRDPVGIGTGSVAIGLANGDVAVLDVAAGALQWTAHTGSSDATAPSVASGHLYVGAADGRLSAFPAAGCGQATCAPEWSGATRTGTAVSHQPAVAAGVVYVGTSAGRVYAFDAGGCGAAACSTLWSGAVNPTGPAAPVLGPVVSDGSVYASAGTVLAAFRRPGS
jgi:hypothetical protein